jgi:hypothetical protein
VTLLNKIMRRQTATEIRKRPLVIELHPSFIAIYEKGSHHKRTRDTHRFGARSTGGPRRSFYRWGVFADASWRFLNGRAGKRDHQLPVCDVI